MSSSSAEIVQFRRRLPQQEALPCDHTDAPLENTMGLNISMTIGAMLAMTQFFSTIGKECEMGLINYWYPKHQAARPNHLKLVHSS